MTDETRPEPGPPDAVVLRRLIAEDGSVSVQVETVGDIRLTEVATIIDLAGRRWQAQIGARPGG